MTSLFFPGPGGYKIWLANSGVTVLAVHVVFTYVGICLGNLAEPDARCSVSG